MDATGVIYEVLNSYTYDYSQYFSEEYTPVSLIPMGYGSVNGLCVYSTSDWNLKYFDLNTKTMVPLSNATIGSSKQIKNTVSIPQVHLPGGVEGSIFICSYMTQDPERITAQLCIHGQNTWTPYYRWIEQKGENVTYKIIDLFSAYMNTTNSSVDNEIQELVGRVEQLEKQDSEATWEEF